jgi:hypothetical protein
MSYINDFRIETDGDINEKLGWNLFIKEKFQNYDIFWANFIAPNTRRLEKPPDIWFKDGTSDEIRIICMLHYGIFMHFLFIYKNFNNMNDIDMFRYSYIKLSSIIDLTEEFLVKFLIHIKKIDPIEIIETFEGKQFGLSRVQLTKQFNKKNNLSIPLMSRFEIIEKHYNLNILKIFKKHSGGIRGYRNILIHSWPMFQINNKVPKKEIVLDIEYRDWTKIVNKLKSREESIRLLNAEFIEMDKLIIKDTEEIISFINAIWEFVISDLKSFK